MTKKGLIVILVFLGIAIGAFLVFGNRQEEPYIAPLLEIEYPVREVVGQSVEGRDIESYTWGDGETRLLFVGGIHGGYEWNSVLLAYEFIDYFNANPSTIPETISVTIIPSANPDGVFEVIGKEGRFTLADTAGALADGTGRFNANDVDLNRNFDCKWQPESTWRNIPVSAGMSAFSEPEAQAIRDVVQGISPDGVVFWHSQANNVYASECLNGPLAETLDIMNAYAAASGYGAVASFDAYPVTGDAEGWLASIGIPAITVELGSHTSLEWSKNVAGVEALFAYYSSNN